MTPVACSFSAITSGLRIVRHSTPTLRLCATSTGSCTRSNRSPDPNRCCATCRAIPIRAFTPVFAGYRIAISNRRLIAADEKSVTFKYKDYRIEGPGRYTTMTLDTHEFIRRFLMHVLPKGFHRIRHYGLARQRQPRRQHREGTRAARHARPGKGT